MQIDKIKKQIEHTINCEKQTYKDGGNQDKNVQGWIEGLQYAMNLLDKIDSNMVYDSLKNDIDRVEVPIVYCKDNNGNMMYDTEYMRELFDQAINELIMEIK